MNTEVAPQRRTWRTRWRIWREILVGAFLLWAAGANLRPALELRGAYRGTAISLLLLVCECLLMIGSAISVLIAGRALLAQRAAAKEGVCEIGNARRLRNLALLGLLGLAWCLGTLR
jgi:hypothetical protein